MSFARKSCPGIAPTEKISQQNNRYREIKTIREHYHAKILLQCQHLLEIRALQAFPVIRGLQEL